jgi:molecular chaperone DnaK
MGLTSGNGSEEGAVVASSVSQTNFLTEGLKLPGGQAGFEPKREGPIFGVDLGTTNSCVAVVENGVPKVLKDSKGRSTIPSLVTITEQGAVLVGYAAVNRLRTHPAQTVNESKRLIGAPHNGRLATMMKERVLYSLCPGAQGQAAVVLQGRGVRLEEIAALILLEARQMAEAHYGRSVHRCVITCPAAYNELQRAAVRRAGRLAGMRVERVINEPTAASVAYGYRRQEDKKLAVFDLGGGTFDATVLHMKGSLFEVLASGGDTFLGGADFDDMIVDYLLDEFYDLHDGVDLIEELEPQARLRQAAVNAKHVLSSRRETTISLPMLMMGPDGKPLDLRVNLTDEELGRIVDPLVERTIQGLNTVIRARGLKPEDIDDVLLVGGQTRMPAVQKRLEKYFGKPPSKGINPDEAVARGAAIVAHAIMVPGSQLNLKDVVSKTVGIADPRYGEYIKVVPASTPVPTSETYVVTTHKHKQTVIKLHVFQGEAKALDENEFLGTLVFDKLPKLPRGEVKIEIQFTVNDENILELEALEMSSGKHLTAWLSLEGGVPEAGRPTTKSIIKEGQKRRGLLSRLLRR